MTVPAWLDAELAHVPPYETFAGVDDLVEKLRELSEQHPDFTELQRIGTSAQGEPIWCLTVDDGTAQQDALAVGLPHPNEPIGGLTATHLAQRVCDDEGLRQRLGLRWHVVACVDPDGLRLNEGWLAGPFDRATYARHFYRPAGPEQVEWTFPIDEPDAYWDTPTPETQALVRLIDTTRPALLASLHNSELGGAYYYLSRPEPPLHPVLQALPERHGIPLDVGEPESSSSTRFADAIFESPAAPRLVEKFTAGGRAWPLHGGTSTTYSARYGTLTLLCELPYWADPATGDDTPSDEAYCAVLREWGEALHEVGELLRKTVAATDGKLLAPTAPLWRATRSFARSLLPAGEATIVRAENADPARRATVAEAASLRNNVHAYRLRFGGMALRALEHEHGLGNVTSAVRAALNEWRPRYAQWVAEDAAAVQHPAIDIGQLVRVQYGAVLAAAAHLSGQLE